MSKNMQMVAKAINSLPDAIPGEDLPVVEWLFENTRLYVRALFIDAGQMILGKEHAEWNVNILTEGTLIVMSDPYSPKVKVEAPFIFETGPGSQKLVKALTDCVFMNIVGIKKGETKEDVFKRMVKESECQLLG